MKFVIAALAVLLGLCDLYNAFDFNKLIDWKVYQGHVTFWPCRWLSSISPRYVAIMMYNQVGGVHYKPDISTFQGGKYRGEIIDRYLLTMGTQVKARLSTNTAPVPTMMIFEYFNSSHCKVRKVFTLNEALASTSVTVASGTKTLVDIMESVAQRPAENCTWTDPVSDICFNNSLLAFNPNYYNRNDVLIVATMTSSFNPESDFDDPQFYKLMSIGPGALPIWNNRISPEANNVLNYSPLEVTYLPNAYDTWFDTLTSWNMRFTRDYNIYGFSLEKARILKVRKTWDTTPGTFPTVHFYVYNLSTLLQGVASSTNNLVLSLDFYTPADKTNNVIVKAKVTFKTSASQVLQVFLNLEYYLGGSTQTLVTSQTTGPIDLDSTYYDVIDPTSAAGWTSNGFTVSLSAGVNYITRKISALDTFEGEVVGLLSIFKGELDKHFADATPQARKMLSNRISFTASDARDIYGNHAEAQISWNFILAPATTPPVDVRLRLVEFNIGLRDYSEYNPSYYTTTDFTAYGLCLNPIPPYLVSNSDSTKCNDWLIKNQSPPAGCNRTWSTGTTCEYCNDGHGTDILNYRYNNTVCRKKEICDTLDFFYWINNGTAGTDLTTGKALCVSCPLNCKKCDHANCLLCTDQSTFETVTGTPDLIRCKCNKANCTVCIDSECDLCTTYDNHNKLGNALHINSNFTPPARECKWTPSLNCSIGYGVNNTYVYGNFPKANYLTCSTCLVPNCMNCSSDNTKCQECYPGFSLLNLNLALGTDYANFYNCTTDRRTYMGLYENSTDPTTSNYYLKCVLQNCKNCINNITSCTECMPGYHFSPNKTACILDSWCQAWTSGLYLTANTPQQCELCATPTCIFCKNITSCLNCTEGNVVYETTKTTANATQCIPTVDCGETTYTYLTMIQRFNGIWFSACLDCLPNCKRCFDGLTCDLCLPGYYYHSVAKQCITQTDCNDIYKSYVSSPTTCTNCTLFCKTCVNNSFCDVCEDTHPLYHLDKNECVTTAACGPTLNSYSFNRFCKSCKAQCQSCSTDTDCWKCIGTRVLDSDNVTCLATCKPLTTLMNATHCVDCPKNCASCHYDPASTFGPVVCDSCLPGFAFNYQNVCDPCTGTLKFVANSRCLMCKADKCLKCQDAETKCVDCQNNYYVDPSFSCKLCEHPLVYTVNKACLPCESDNCETCNHADLTFCKECKRGYYIEGQRCAPHFFLVTSATFSAEKLTIKLTFEHQLKNLTLSNINVYTQLPGNSTNVPLAVETVSDSSTPKSYNIKIARLSKDPDLLMFLVFNDTFLVQSADKSTYTLDPRNRTVPLKPVSRYVPDSELRSEAAKSVSAATSIAVLIGSIISFNYAMMMMKIYQMMEFMLLYNVAYPYNFQQFILIFKTVDPLSMLPDVFESLYDNTCADLGEKFVLQDMGCQFFNNCGSTVLIFCVYIGLRLANKLLWRLVRHKEGRVVAFITRLKTGPLGPKGAYSLISMFEMDFLLGAFTNSKFYAGDSTWTFQNMGNHLISQTLVYLYPAVIVYYYAKTKQIFLHRNGQIDLTDEAYSEYEFLTEGRKDQRPVQQYFEIAAMVRSYLICMCVVGFYDHPKVQLITTSTIILVTLVMQLLYRPQTNKMECIITCVMWILYFGLTMCFCMVYFMSESFSKEKIYTVFGYPMIFLFCGLIILNFIPISISLVMTIVKLLRKCCKKKSEKFDSLPNKEKSTNESSLDKSASIDVDGSIRGSKSRSPPSIRQIIGRPIAVLKSGKSKSGSGIRVNRVDNSSNGPRPVLRNKLADNSNK